MLTLTLNRAVLWASLCAMVAAAMPTPRELSRSLCKDSPGKIELTQADLLSGRDWNSTAVSVLGFRLGMTRRQATETAGGQGLRLADHDIGGACRGSMCDVLRRFVWVGISVWFGADGCITRIEVGVPPFFADPAVKAASVVRRFKGVTHQFFSQYSDALRVKLLGTGAVERRTGISARSPVAGVLYAYPDRGVEIYVSRDKSSPREVIELSMSFVLPREPRPLAPR